MNLRCRLWKSAFIRQILEILLCFSGLDRGESAKWIFSRVQTNWDVSSEHIHWKVLIFWNIFWVSDISFDILKYYDILKYLLIFWNISIFWNIYMKWIFWDCRQMRLYQVSRPGESRHLEETSTGSWAALWLRCHIYFEHHIYSIKRSKSLKVETMKSTKYIAKEC